MQEWAPSIAVAADSPTQVGDILDHHINRREGVQHCWIVGITNLPREQGRVANVDQENNRVRGLIQNPRDARGGNPGDNRSPESSCQ
jgi:hypothetical protein